MYRLNEFCFMCFEHHEKLQNIATIDTDNLSIQDKLGSFLPEKAFLQSEIPKYICNDCLKYSNSIYEFRQKSLINITALNEYIQKYLSKNNSSDCLVIPLEDIFCDKIEKESPDTEKTNFDLISAADIKIEILENDSNSYYELENSYNEVENVIIKVEDLNDISIKEELKDLEDNSRFEDNRTENFLQDYNAENYEDFNLEFRIEDTHIGEITDNNSSDDDDFEATSSASEGNNYEKENTLSKSDLTCSYCPRAFKNRSLLERHYRTHTGEKPFQCSTCGKKFGHTGHLNRHKLIHIGQAQGQKVKLFTCEVCNKSFNQSGNLTRHKRIHTNERPFKCGLCEKTFTDGSSCRSHLRTHTQERAFSCSLCPKSFNRSTHLKDHMKTHRKNQI